MIAMKNAGVDIEKYTAFEIDEYAVSVATKNFPEIDERGDVFEADFSEFYGYDFLIGGSPCTSWSIAQKHDRRETKAHGLGWELFQQYVKALNTVKPKFFIYENNKSMSDDIKKSISEAFGFDPVCINSALVSAQIRKRLYWIGRRNCDGSYSKIDVRQPEDKGILLKDVLTNAIAMTKKSYCITATEFKGQNLRGFLTKHRRTLVAETITDMSVYGRVNTHKVSNGYVTIGDDTYPVTIDDGFYKVRKLSVDECKRLQTVPEWYDFSGVSDTQAYKMLGNGWTCDVITHLIKACLNEDNAHV